MLSVHGLNFLTCFLDVGKVSCDRSCVAKPTLVLRKDPEGIGVANNEIGDDAAGSVVTLQYCEPELWGPQGMTRVRHLGFVCGAARSSFRTPPSLLPRCTSPQIFCQPSAPCIPGELYCPYLVEVSIPE